MPHSEEQNDDIDTVVQPDIVVVCDRKKLDEKGCKGAPDLVIEILSPYTAHKDLNEKFRHYERVCVNEYWIPIPWTGRSWFRHNGECFGRPAMFAGKDRIEVPLLGELIIDLKQAFFARD